MPSLAQVLERRQHLQVLNPSRDLWRLTIQEALNNRLTVVKMPVAGATFQPLRVDDCLMLLVRGLSQMPDFDAIPFPVLNVLDTVLLAEGCHRRFHSLSATALRARDRVGSPLELFQEIAECPGLTSAANVSECPGSLKMFVECRALNIRIQPREFLSL